MDKAVFYARVSTEEEKQVNALQKQIQECKDVIKAKGWELVDSYIDEGISGTTAKRRNEYKRLYEDLYSDKFDIIVIKDQDRLMRNTTDWYLFVDRLVTNDKRLYMYLENQYYSTDTRLITGIKAIMAEEYSRNLSKKINNANKRRIATALNGEALSVIGRCYGYDTVGKSVVINPSQAEVVKYIFDSYISGIPLRQISDDLKNKGITGLNNGKFYPSNIGKIIKNERYKGTVVVNRKHYDFEQKKTIYNPPEDWIYFEDCIPAIISKDKWDKANSIMAGRRYEGMGKKIGTYPLSGKVICGKCGKVYWSNYHPTGLRWVCSTYRRYGKKEGQGCCNKSVSDKHLMDIIKDIADGITVNKEVVKDSLLKWLDSLRNSLGDEADKNITEEIKRQEGRKNRLTEAYMDNIISKADYKLKYAEIERTIKTLQAELEDMTKNNDLAEIKRIIKDIDKELDIFVGSKEFGQSKVDFVLEHIKAIVIYDNDIVFNFDALGGATVLGKNFYLYVISDRSSLSC